MKLGMDTHLLTEKQFLDTYTDESKGRFALEELTKIGVFPLTLKNPLVIPINILGNYTYFNGSLTSNQKYQASISNSSNRPIHVPYEFISESLELTFLDNERSLVYGVNGTRYARVLSAMGFHTSDNVSRKAESGSTLPNYLKGIISNQFICGKNARISAQRLVRDMINTWVDSKSNTDAGRGLQIHLLTQPTEDKFYTEAKLIADAVNYIYPKVGLSMGQLRVHKVRDKTCGSFRLTAQQIDSWETYMTCPLRLQLSVKPHFSYGNSQSRFNRAKKSSIV